MPAWLTGWVVVVYLLVAAAAVWVWWLGAARVKDGLAGTGLTFVAAMMLTLAGACFRWLLS